jgi:hypothetical protein
MRKLSKVLKVAKLEGKNPDIALDEFLAAYHDTPHSATGVAPNILMFGRARTSGLPALKEQESIEFQAQCHEIARKKHKEYNDRMKRQYDQQMKSKECPIRQGDKVLFKRDITRKDVSPWDPDPFTVVLVKGSLVTESRLYPKQQSITRNSSCFKLYRGVDAAEMQVTTTVQPPKPTNDSEEQKVAQEAAVAEQTSGQQGADMEADEQEQQPQDNGDKA